jgi:hypothetical protein
MSNSFVQELSEYELDHVTGGETAPGGSATQTTTQGETVASPDWGRGRGWCYWHPYVCRK